MLKNSDASKDLKADKSKSPINRQPKNDKESARNTKIDRLAQPKNRTEPYKSDKNRKSSNKENQRSNENSRSKSPNQN